MVFKVVVSPRALQEIENAIEYYGFYSTDAPLVFITALKESFKKLETSPFYRVRYKDVRSIKIKKFPYSLYFIINESKSTVRVLSCFHIKRNPNKRPGV